MGDIELEENALPDTGIFLEESTIQSNIVGIGPICFNDGERELILSIEDGGKVAAVLSSDGEQVCAWDFNGQPLYFNGSDASKALDCMRKLLIKIIKG